MSNLWQLVVENFWGFLIGTVFFGFHSLWRSCPIRSLGFMGDVSPF